MNASWQHFALGGAVAGLVVGFVVFGSGHEREAEHGAKVEREGRSVEFRASEAAASVEPLPAAPEPIPVAIASVAQEGRRAPPAASSMAKHAWRKLARAGHFSRAFEAAAAEGFEQQCERASAADLMLLGDAARLSAHRAQAAQAYEALCRRFAGSGAAARAAFALGRLASDSGDHADAMRWFESYLAMAPSGALAPSAVDRLLEAALRRGDSAQARAVAERYLARYPKGAYAGDARSLLMR